MITITWESPAQEETFENEDGSISLVGPIYQNGTYVKDGYTNKIKVVVENGERIVSDEEIQRMLEL